MTIFSTSPFGSARLDAPEQETDQGIAGETFAPPFSGRVTSIEDATTYSEFDDVSGQLVSELDDDRFAEALEALVAEGSGRYLRALTSPYGASEASAREEPARWLAFVGERTDAILSELEAQLGDRPLDSLAEDDISSALGRLELESAFTSPSDAQELFWGSIVNKVKKAVKGGVELAKKGVKAVAKLTLGPLLRLIKSKAAALLSYVMKKFTRSALAKKVPPELRSIVSQLAAKLGLSDSEADADELITGQGLAEWFDREIAAAVVDGRVVTTPAPPGIAAELEQELERDSRSTCPGADPLADLDRARQSLARELLEAPEGVPPVEQLERFLPAVLAAKPAIKLAVKAIGRPRIISLLARPIATLLQGKIGKPAAQQISTYLAGAGLGLLGFEAETDGDDGLRGAEALVATAEDAISRLLELPAESLENEMLVAAEAQEAFTDAAVRSLPSAVLRPDLTGGDTESGVWMLLPRGGAQCRFRFRKYSRRLPVLLNPAAARAIVIGEGETLEDRVLESGNDAWPVEAEVELYELLPGGTIGHLTEFESAGNSLDSLGEFGELSPVSAAALTGNPALGGAGRLARISVNGVPLQRRSRFSLRSDLASETPRVTVRLFVGERTAHLLSTILEKRQMLQVVATVRGLLTPALNRALAARLSRMFARRGLALAPGADDRLASALTASMLRAVADRLPAAAPALAQAAQDAAPGVTLAFDFTFASRSALASATTASVSALVITPGTQRG